MKCIIKNDKDMQQLGTSPIEATRMQPTAVFFLSPDATDGFTFELEGNTYYVLLILEDKDMELL